MGRADVLAVLVRRARRGHARLHPRRRRSMRSSAGDTFYTHNLGIAGTARGDRRLRVAAAPAGRRRAHRRHQLGHVGADARHAGAGRPGRPRRRRDAAVAEPGRDPEDPRRDGRRACALRVRPDAAGRSTSTACSRRSRRGTRARLRQLAEQSDRLDDRRARRSTRSSRIAAGTASGSSPTMPTSGSTTAARRRQSAPVVPRSRRRPTTASSAPTRSPRSWLMTGLAAGLDRRAGGARPRSRAS